jgi:hypothetical protein
MAVLYWEVKNTFLRASAYTTSLGASHSLRRSGDDQRKVAVQAMLYALSFVITWLPSTVWSVANWFQLNWYGFHVAAALFEPLQGFWNFLIFIRGRPKTRRKIRTFLSTTLPCIFSPPSEETLRSSRFSSENGPRLSTRASFLSRSFRPRQNGSIDQSTNTNNSAIVIAKADASSSSMVDIKEDSNDQDTQLDLSGSAKNGTTLHKFSYSHGLIVSIDESDELQSERELKAST